MTSEPRSYNTDQRSYDTQPRSYDTEAIDAAVPAVSDLSEQFVRIHDTLNRTLAAYGPVWGGPDDPIGGPLDLSYLPAKASFDGGLLSLVTATEGVARNLDLMSRGVTRTEEDNTVNPVLPGAPDLPVDSGDDEKK